MFSIIFKVSDKRGSIIGWLEETSSTKVVIKINNLWEISWLPTESQEAELGRDETEHLWVVIVLRKHRSEP